MRDAVAVAWDAADVVMLLHVGPCHVMDLGFRLIILDAVHAGAAQAPPSQDVVVALDIHLVEMQGETLNSSATQR